MSTSAFTEPEEMIDDDRGQMMFGDYVDLERSHVAIRAPGYAERAEPYIPATLKGVKLHRCPTCGGKVSLPCVRCSLD